LGKRHSCAHMSNDTMKCWGDAAYGAIGNGSNFDMGSSINSMGSILPILDLGTGRTVVNIEAGPQNSCAELDDGTIKCWGYNKYAQLGQGDFVSRGSGPGEMGDNLPPIHLAGHGVLPYDFTISGVSDYLLGPDDTMSDAFLGVNLTPRFHWSTSLKSTIYDLRVRDALDTVDVCTPASNINSLNFSYNPVDCTLTDGQSYIVRVVARNGINATAAPDYHFTVDVMVPTASLSGQPVGPSSTTVLNVNVVDLSDSNFYSYRYKIGETASTDCTVSLGYSGDVDESQNITDDLSGLPNVSLTLCVLGRDKAGNLQEHGNATRATWTKIP